MTSTTPTQATREGTALVFLNEQHTLLPSQEDALNARFETWNLIRVPATGWTLSEMDETLNAILPMTNVVFGSPIPYMIGAASSRARNEMWGVFILHNDKRCAKEVKDRETGQTKVIHTLAPDGWQLVQVA